MHTLDESPSPVRATEKIFKTQYSPNYAIFNEYIVENSVISVPGGRDFVGITGFRRTPEFSHARSWRAACSAGGMTVAGVDCNDLFGRLCI